MHDKHPLLPLAFALVTAATAGACGSSTPKVQPEPSPTASPTDGATEPSPEPGPATEPGTQPGPDPTTKASPKVDPVPVAASKLLADVQKTGGDMKTPLEKIPLGAKKKLMPLFQKALGYEACTGCHAAENDFKTETRNMKIARQMWNEYVVKLRDNAGKAIFCDSCHNGKTHMIPRHDKELVQKFMKDEYEGKMTRADKEEHSCSTCHGDAFETQIFKKLWNIQ